MIEIKPGLRFKEGDVGFTVIEQVKDKGGYWYVAIAAAGSNFGFSRFGGRKTTPAQPKEMPEERIRELAERYIGDRAARTISTTGNGSSGGSSPRKIRTGRKPLRFSQIHASVLRTQAAMPMRG